MNNQQQDRDRAASDDMQLEGASDTTRSQNRQGVEEEGRRTTAGTDRSEGNLADDKGPHRDDAGHTGSHAEGMYAKQEEGGATGGQMARDDQGGAAQGQVGKPGDKPE